MPVVSRHLLLAATLATLVLAPLVEAAGRYGMPQDVSAKMNRLMARNNRLAADADEASASEDTTGTSTYDLSSGYASYSRTFSSNGYASGCAGCSDISIGSISQSTIRGSLEMNTLVNGDIVIIDDGD